MGVLRLKPPPLLPQTILVRLFPRRRCLLFPFHVNSRMLPPPYPHPCLPSFSTSPHRGPEAIIYKYTAQPYSDFAECKSPLDQTPPPLSPTTPRYTATSHLDSAAGSATPVSTPPVHRKPLGTVPCGG